MSTNCNRISIEMFECCWFNPISLAKYERVDSLKLIDDFKFYWIKSQSTRPASEFFDDKCKKSGKILLSSVPLHYRQCVWNMWNYIVSNGKNINSNHLILCCCCCCWEVNTVSSPYSNVCFITQSINRSGFGLCNLISDWPFHAFNVCANHFFLLCISLLLSCRVEQLFTRWAFTHMLQLKLIFTFLSTRLICGCMSLSLSICFRLQFMANVTVIFC